MIEGNGPQPPERDPGKGAAIVIGVLLVLVGAGLIGSRVWAWVWPGFTPWGFYFGEWRRWTFAIGLVVVGIVLVGFSSRISVKLPSRESRLYRSRSNRMVSGVLGGLADYFSLDPTFLRLAFAAFALIIDAGAAIVVYIIATVIMPEEPVAGGSVGSPPVPPAPPANRG